MRAYGFVVCSVLVLMTGCQKLEQSVASRGAALAGPVAKPAEEPADVPALEGAPVDPLALRAEQAEAFEPKRIIRNAELSFRTDDYVACRQVVLSALERHGGYLASEREENTGWSLRNTMLLRVPAERLDALLGELTSQAAFVEARNVTAQDVTEQFVDLQARLKTKREVEASYQRLLGRAASVEEVLAIEKELRVVREEVEAVEGRLRYLTSQVAYSSVALSFYQQRDPPEDPDRGMGHQIWSALTTGLEWLYLVLVGLLYLWPFLLASALVVVVVRRVRRRRKLRA